MIKLSVNWEALLREVYSRIFLFFKKKRKSPYVNNILWLKKEQDKIGISITYLEGRNSTYLQTNQTVQQHGRKFVDFY